MERGIHVEFRIEELNLARLECSAVSVGVFEGETSSHLVESLDHMCGGQISGLLQDGDFVAKKNATFLLRTGEGTPIRRILLVGLGERRAFCPDAFGKPVPPSSEPQSTSRM